MSMEHQPERPPALRATDQDRDNAAAMVQDAHGDGRLDLEEMDDRLSRVYASKTRDELTAITADLVPFAPGGVSDTLTLSTENSPVSRTGQWRVPPHIVATTGNTPIRLDFTGTVVRLSEILVEVNTRHAPVVLTVPEGWRLDYDGVQPINAGVRNKTVPGRPGMPLLRITGQTRNGPVVVRHPRRRRRWWPFGRR